MISLHRVAVNNLKDIDLDLPLGKLIVFCGRSGSGKSSLALDTLYAEGQRRYIETFSPAMRQFLEKIEKPKAERLDGIPPTILLSSAVCRLPSSLTVGDATGLSDYLAMLFTQVGHVFCPKCSRPITADSPQSVWQTLNTVAEKESKIQIAFAPPLEKTSAEFADLWKEQGFLRGCLIGKVGNRPPGDCVGDSRLGCAEYRTLPPGGRQPTFHLDEPIPDELYREGLLLIVDRLTFDPAEEDRFIESLETAFDYGEGKCFVLAENKMLRFSRSLSCEYCNVYVPSLTTKLFRTHWIDHVHLHADVNSPTMSELSQLTIAELIRFFATNNPKSGGHTPPDESLTKNIQSRLRFMHQVGLEYLTLSRTMDTLSGGEQRRIALTAALGSSLVDMLYVLDEPSLGLHAKDTEKLLEAILELRNRGNTVILVEHDEQLLLHADHIVEIGPGAGDDGGNIVFQGHVEELLTDTKSLTGKYLTTEKVGNRPPGDSRQGCAEYRTLPPGGRQPTSHVTITNCHGNNLKNITATFPLGVLCVVTGVSGAGKSSLIRQTLYPALCQHFGKKCEVEGLPFEQINMNGNVNVNDCNINDIVLIDQTPMGRSSSSNPATYLKIFDDIRSVFAATVDAKAKHITARHFSFNVQGGRCEHCKGDGNITIDMQFLPDQIVPCPECFGKRYQQSVLDILYRGRNIAEVLEMTAHEAFSFFRGQSKLQQKLRLLFDVGLDYLRLGQPANTLSGGEAQRLRLATYLGQIRGSRALILMDEPTAGLHFADVEQMLTCFQSLLASGHSLIVIEHNERVIRAADYRIELGPGAGDCGGEITMC
jgi:excinuclease ABC subunit A